MKYKYNDKKHKSRQESKQVQIGVAIKTDVQAGNIFKFLPIGDYT